ncbi:MAG: YggU family protein [Acidobacteria bacterium]|nr:YggU family protein [Acidobacteriota bacterium]
MSDAVQFAFDTPDGCTLSVRVHPGAKRNAVTGLHAGAVKIALTAPPVDGKANEALIAFVAEQLRLPRSKVALVAGATSRSKTLRITGKSAAEVHAALSPDQDA